MQVCRPLIILFCVILFISSVQATSLTITVQDDSDGSPVQDASIFIDGKYEGRTEGNGILPYSHMKTESLHVRVSKSGYEEWNNLVSPTETVLSVELSPKSEPLSINLYDAATLHAVPDATVIVRGENFTASQLTDSGGKAVFTVKTQNTYTIEVKASHYDSFFRTVQFGTSAKTVQYWLFRSDQFVLQVVDAATQKPLADARVMLDGRAMGATGEDGKLAINLDRERRYTIQVEKENYQIFSQERLISVEDVVLTIPLSKSSYTLFVSVFDASRRPVEGAEIYINGTYQGRTDPFGRFGLSSVEAGPHLIEVKRRGYDDWKETREIENAGEDIVAQLVCSMANVRIIVEDTDKHILSGATISIDGTTIGTTNDLGSYTTALQTAATYNITGALAGYRKSSVQREIPFGTSELTITLSLEREFNIALLLAGVMGLAALGIIFFSVRKIYGERKAKRPRRKLS